VSVAPSPAHAIAVAPQKYFYLGPDLALTRLDAGPMLYVDPLDEHVSANIIVHGYWEAWVHNVVMALLLPGSRVIEVGANVGYYTTTMAQKVGVNGRVTALEANPRLVSLVRRSLLLNNFAGRAEVIGKAAMDTPGTIRFVTSRTNSGGGFVTIWQDAPYEDAVTSEIEAIRLDDLNCGHVDLIRIDAEGSEPFILRGAEKILRQHRDIVVCMEWSVIQMGSRTSVPEFVAWLSAMGFRFWRIGYDSSLAEVPADAMHEIDNCDVVMSRHWPKQLSGG
jgi:FkbM family methyltransferase